MTEFPFYTTLNRYDKEKYPCHGDKECFSTWTYDNWHCTGCHWKGMGTMDVKTGNTFLKSRAKNLFVKLNPDKDVTEFMKRIEND